MSFRRRVSHALGDRGLPLRLLALKHIAHALIPGYRLKYPQLDWWSNEPFNQYLDRFDERKGHNTDRRWIIHQLLRLTTNVPGDTAECGVFAGAGSYLILRANERDNLHKRTHYMFDSFEGLSQPDTADGSYWQAGDMAMAEDAVRHNLRDCSNYVAMKGWIPSRFAEVAGRRFSFVHIDVDLYEPTRDSLAFFLPRMTAGGIIVVDDYGFATCPGATQAVDDILRHGPEKMLAMPDGGGFLIKGQATADGAQLDSSTHYQK